MLTMKMKTLAVAVPALAWGTQTLAAEIYYSDGTSMSIGGHVAVGVGEYFEEDVRVHQVSPRINVAGKKDIGNGVTVDAKGEWALNYLSGGEQSFSTRLGYIGATHAELGRVVVGTQWSPYYDVASATDMPIAFANDFLYSDYYNLGSARAERMVSYRNSFELGEGMAFNLGAGWQGEHEGYDARGQITLGFDVAGVGLGYAYNGGDISEVAIGTKTAESHIFSAKYGNYGSGLYAALVYGMNDYFFVSEKVRVPETNQLEALLAYGVNDWTFSVNYEAVENGKDSKTLYSHSALQAEYAVTSSFYTFAAYQFDLGDDYGSEENDYWTLGARYYF
jgi:predicted porin